MNLRGCRRCGDCCRCIGLPYTKKEMRGRLARGEFRGANLESARFILSHWRRQGRRAAARATPGVRLEPGVMYYQCDWQQGDLCSHHDRRPPICRGFPFYELPPNANVDDSLPTRRCGFHSSWAAPEN